MIHDTLTELKRNSPNEETLKKTARRTTIFNISLFVIYQDFAITQLNY